MRCFSVVLHNTKILNLSLRLKARDFPPDGDINPEGETEGFRRGIRLKDLKNALTDFSKSLDIDHNNSTDYNLRGIIKYELGDYDGAMLDYNQAIEINPENAEAYLSRGFAKWKLDFQAALTEFYKAIEIDPDSPDANYMIGLITAYSKNDYEGAIPFYNKLIDINPKDAYSYLARGNCRETFKDYILAIEDFSKAIEIEPKHSWAYFQRSLAYHNINDKENYERDQNKWRMLENYK
jgi:tetratricopeptide (TPR) repeat protein